MDLIPHSYLAVQSTFTIYDFQDLFVKKKRVEGPVSIERRGRRTGREKGSAGVTRSMGEERGNWEASAGDREPGRKGEGEKGKPVAAKGGQGPGRKGKREASAGDRGPGRKEGIYHKTRLDAFISSPSLSTSSRKTFSAQPYFQLGQSPLDSTSEAFRCKEGMNVCI